MECIIVLLLGVVVCITFMYIFFAKAWNSVQAFANIVENKALELKASPQQRASLHSGESDQVYISW